jgi:hypothetical protein
VVRISAIFCMGGFTGCTVLNKRRTLGSFNLTLAEWRIFLGFPPSRPSEEHIYELCARAIVTQESPELDEIM